MPFEWNDPRPRQPASRVDQPAGPGTRMGPKSDWNLLSLRGDVGRNGRNRRPDVARLEALLGAAGYLDLSRTDGPTGYFGERVDRAVRDFQKDHGLRVDGEVKPQGETLAQLFRKTGVKKDEDRDGPVLDPDPQDADQGPDDGSEQGLLDRLLDWLSGRIRKPQTPAPGRGMDDVRG